MKRVLGAVLVVLWVAAVAWAAPASAAQNATLQGLAVAPTPAQGDPGTSVTLQGTGYEACPDYGNRRVAVLWDGYGTGVSAPIDGAGTFTASFPIPADAPAGDHWVYGQCVDSGEWARAVVTVTTARVPAQLAVQLSSAQGTPGSEITVRGTGYQSCPDYGTRRADVLWDGRGTGVSAPIDADGTFTATLRVADDATVGEHLVYGRCVDGGEWATATYSVATATQESGTGPGPTSAPTTGAPPTGSPGPSGQVVPPPGSPDADPGEGTGPAGQESQGDGSDGSDGSGGSGGDAGQPWDRPGFLDAIPTPGEVWAFLTSPGALALLVVPLLAWFLIGWPAELFNTTYRENEATIRRWLPFLPGPRPARATSWPVVVAFAGVAAILVTLVQVNVTTLSQAVPVAFGYFIAIPLVVLAYEFAIEQRLRTVPGGGTARLRVVGAALVLAVACAVVSRVVEFEPGYVYGLLLGYTIVQDREGWQARVKAQAVLRGVVVLLALAVCAWLLWQFGTRAAAEEPGAAAALVALDTLLSQIVVLSLETLVIGLLPVQFLHGAILRQWDRRVWVAVYGLVAALFWVVLVRWRPGATWEGALRSFWLFGGFCVGSAIFWAIFAIRERLVRTGIVAATVPGR